MNYDSTVVSSCKHPRFVFSWSNFDEVAIDNHVSLSNLFIIQCIFSLVVGGQSSAQENRGNDDFSAAFGGQPLPLKSSLAINQIGSKLVQIAKGVAFANFSARSAKIINYLLFNLI